MIVEFPYVEYIVIIELSVLVCLLYGIYRELTYDDSNMKNAEPIIVTPRRSKIKVV